jgi:ABC-type Fe3+/spermidine/putrescine transport system ATPase subunit
MATNGSARIEIDAVGKRFGDLQVFNSIDLQIGEREIVSIVGPSGCGKTTLLRCIDGLVPYDSGEIRIAASRSSSSTSASSRGSRSTRTSRTGCASRRRRRSRSPSPCRATSTWSG